MQNKENSFYTRVHQLLVMYCVSLESILKFKKVHTFSTGDTEAFSTVVRTSPYDITESQDITGTEIAALTVNGLQLWHQLC